jgi:hypothetical protein
VLGALVLPAACPAKPTSKPFLQFGDNADYSLVPGGNFESRLSGWSLDEAEVVRGNSIFSVGGQDDRRSLRIDPGGRARSAGFCVGAAHPSFRFFARGRRGKLVVRLRWRDHNDKKRQSVVGTLKAADGYASWLPTPSLELAPALDLPRNETADVRIVFSNPDDEGGAWTIDDVYIDPYRR